MTRTEMLLLSPKDRKEALERDIPSWAVKQSSVFDWLYSAARQKGRLESWSSRADLRGGWVETDTGNIEYITLTTIKEFVSPWTAIPGRGPKAKAESNRPWGILGLVYLDVCSQIRGPLGREGLILAMQDIEIETRSIEDIPDWTGDLPWEST